jgi:hypothetical protein
MNDASALLQARRQVILDRIAVQRCRLALGVRALHRPLRYIDVATHTWQLFRRHPGFTLCGIASIVAAWPREMTPGRMVRRAWITWELVQGLRRIWRGQTVWANPNIDFAPGRSRATP